MADPPEILTVGHSNHPMEAFLDLLERHGAAVLADVRSVPYSRWHPHFSRRRLEGSLRERGIRYLFLGAELGARSPDPSCYGRDGRVRYARLARTAAFVRGVERVLAEAVAARVALLCAERDPLDCHRAILVAPEVAQRGASVTHILADGTLEAHHRMLDRLCEKLGMAGRDLFRPRDEQMAEALVRRGEQIAYRDPDRAGRLTER